MSSQATGWRHAGTAERPAATAAFIAVAVLAAHLLFGVGIALSPPLRGTRNAKPPLVFMTELPPTPVTSGSHATITVHPTMTPLRVRATMPQLPDSDAAIVDAVATDSAQVARICGTSHPERSRDDAPQQHATVLVRVADDGRVLDSRLLVSSGSADRDAALQHCLLALARLTPLRVEGHAVDGWQRLRPWEAGASRRP